MRRLDPHVFHVVFEKRELLARTSWFLDSMHLQRLGKTRLDQHLAPNRMPARQRRRTEVCVTVYRLREFIGNCWNAFHHQILRTGHRILRHRRRRQHHCPDNRQPLPPNCLHIILSVEGHAATYRTISPLRPPRPLPFSKTHPWSATTESGYSYPSRRGSHSAGDYTSGATEQT